MQDALTPVRLLRYNSLRIPWEQQIRAHLRAAASSRAYISIGSTSRLNFLALFLGVHSYSRANHGSFGLGSSSDFRMVGDEVALTAATPKLDVKVSLHPAFQCMVIGY